MITIDDLKKRKETILEDIEKVETTIRQLDEQRASLQANLFALQGAAQQVDFFINDEDEGNKDERKNPGNSQISLKFLYFPSDFPYFPLTSHIYGKLEGKYGK